VPCADHVLCCGHGGLPARIPHYGRHRDTRRLHEHREIHDPVLRGSPRQLSSSSHRGGWSQDRPEHGVGGVLSAPVRGAGGRVRLHHELRRPHAPQHRHGSACMIAAAVTAGDRDRRERPSRYILRPPLPRSGAR